MSMKCAPGPRVPDVRQHRRPDFPAHLTMSITLSALPEHHHMDPHATSVWPGPEALYRSAGDLVPWTAFTGGRTLGTGAISTGAIRTRSGRESRQLAQGEVVAVGISGKRYSLAQPAVAVRPR